MDRARAELVAGRFLIGFLGAFAAGFIIAMLGWKLHDSFSGGCPVPTAPNARFGELYYSVYTAVDLVALVAAVTCALCFFRAEWRLGRRHEIGISVRL